MLLAGVKKLYFAKKSNKIMTPAEFATKHGFVPDGANLYIGVNDFNTANFENGIVLNSSHLDFFDMMRDVATNDEKWVMIGLEPPHFTFTIMKDGAPVTTKESGAADPFGFVESNFEYVKALGPALSKQRLDGNNKPKLRIMVRFASEMNDRQLGAQGQQLNAWGHRSKDFKRVFGQVRKEFPKEIGLTFSPAIRADLDPKVNTIKIDGKNQANPQFLLSNYFPGAEHVNQLSCTWYAQPGKFEQSASYFRTYIRQRIKRATDAGWKFAVDELGVGHQKTRTTSFTPNERNATLRAMAEVIEELIDEGAPFEYVTFFLEGPFDFEQKIADILA